MGKFLKHLRKDKWYHGTTLRNWKSICKAGIQTQHNTGMENDFGYGFYLTPKKQEAEKYIINQLDSSFSSPDMLPNTKEFRLSPEALIPVIIEFTFTPLKWYESGDYNFKILNNYDEEFADFVFYNRTENIEGEKQHNYDFMTY
ncbi:DUF3990 domain-containing protein [Proteinivorax tanatarense]|uniref:DUF3990 domain-containing protein n=1 Tax=Proteinivorax tanatarense TaxID=1260629 RepID=A0AAU7VL73_9FIRM